MFRLSALVTIPNGLDVDDINAYIFHENPKGGLCFRPKMRCFVKCRRGEIWRLCSMRGGILQHRFNL